MLDYEQLEEVIEKVTAKITLANRSGELEQLLVEWGLSDCVSKTSAYKTEKDGKIVVIGASEVKENVLCGIIKNFGIDKNT